ncbi:TPA: hypothetical protein ACH3X3_007363 [Trebouxia sp. C0006]
MCCQGQIQSFSCVTLPHTICWLMSACLIVVWLFALPAELDKFGCQRCVSANNLRQLEVAVNGTNPNATGLIFCSAFGRHALLDSKREAAWAASPARVWRQRAWQACKACNTCVHQ